MTDLPMSNVELVLNADTYVTAKTAKVLFQVTFALSDATKDAKTEILAAAAKIDPVSEWYVTGVSAATDRSGIETVNYTLSVRVKESILNSLKSLVEKINRPGLQFVVQSTDYTPERSQIEEANLELRKKIYGLAKTEVALLNELLDEGEAKWVVGNVDFAQHASGNNGNMRGLTSSMYNASSKGMMLESAGGDDEDNGGITQRLAISAVMVATRKIYLDI